MAKILQDSLCYNSRVIWDKTAYHVDSRFRLFAAPV